MQGRVCGKHGLFLSGVGGLSGCSSENFFVFCGGQEGGGCAGMGVNSCGGGGGSQDTTLVYF